MTELCCFSGQVNNQETMNVWLLAGDRSGSNSAWGNRVSLTSYLTVAAEEGAISSASLMYRKLFENMLTGSFTNIYANCIF